MFYLRLRPVRRRVISIFNSSKFYGCQYLLFIRVFINHVVVAVVVVVVVVVVATAAAYVA